MESDNDRENREMKSDPVFHYSREHRLSKASPTLQAYYEEGSAPTGNLKRMFGSRGNKLLLIVILLMSVVISLTSRMKGTENSITLGGNPLSTVITVEEGVLILDIIKNAPKKGSAYAGEVDILVYPVQPKAKEKEANELPPVFSHRIFFTSVYPETFSISLPFTEREISVIFRIANENKNLNLKVIEAMR